MSAARTPFVELSEALRAVPRNWTEIEDSLERLGAAIAVDGKTIAQQATRLAAIDAFMAKQRAFMLQQSASPDAPTSNPPAEVGAHASGDAVPSNEAEHIAPVVHLVTP
jgi:hypothetical protein